MASANCAFPLNLANLTKPSIPRVFPSPASSPSTRNILKTSSSSLLSPPVLSSRFEVFRSMRFPIRAAPNFPESETTLGEDAFSKFKHLLLPVTDKNPYLSEGTRQAAASASALAKKYGADITVLVIDENLKESSPEHDTQLSSIRWHLSQGGYNEFQLIEQLGNGKKPSAIIGEVADDLNSDLVVISMEAIHSKHVDANLLAEFLPCPLLLLPL